MENQISHTGGARIGWVNATWPFAALTATRDSLTLNATLVGRYSFTPDQVVSIERHTVIPVLGWGIRINHNVPKYPKKTVFWCFGSPNMLISRIEEVGFIPQASADSVLSDRGMPVRWEAVAAIIILWNLLFFLDIGLPPDTDAKPGLFSLIAITLLFLGSVSMWRVKWLQRCVLKPGRSPSEIKAWFYLLAVVSGLFSIAMIVTVLAVES